MKPVINIDEAPRDAMSKGTLFAESYTPLSGLIGVKKLGYSITVLPPGKRGCPYHNHIVNEEMFFIIEGEGTYRFGNVEYPVKTGDIMAAPPGGLETAHHLINTSSADLKYLAVSTCEAPDICEYPDNGKFLVVSSLDREDGTRLRYLGRKDNTLDYWDGEAVD